MIAEFRSPECAVKQKNEKPVEFRKVRGVVSTWEFFQLPVVLTGSGQFAVELAQLSSERKSKTHTNGEPLAQTFRRDVFSPSGR